MRNCVAGSIPAPATTFNRSRVHHKFLQAHARLPRRALQGLGMNRAMIGNGTRRTSWLVRMCEPSWRVTSNSSLRNDFTASPPDTSHGSFMPCSTPGRSRNAIARCAALRPARNGIAPPHTRCPAIRLKTTSAQPVKAAPIEGTEKRLGYAACLRLRRWRIPCKPNGSSISAPAM